MKQIYTILCMLIFAGSAYAAGGQRSKEQIYVTSIEQLIEAIAKDDVQVRMAAGDYYVEDRDLALFQSANLATHNNVIDEATCAPTPTGKLYNVITLLNFSGSRSVFDLEGVKIYLNTSLFNLLDKKRLFLAVVSGHESHLKGLSFISRGEDREDNPNHPKLSAVAFTVHGVGNTIEDLYLEVKGSHPYGYGYLYGKSSNKQGIALNKQSSLLVAGSNTHLKGCSVITRAFGHGIVLQGPHNTTIEDCYVEGAMRSTDDIIKNDPLGLAAANAYFSSYPAQNTRSVDYEDGYKITAGEMISLSEDGVRTYARGSSYNTTTTQGVRVIRTVVKNMRGGYHLNDGRGGVVIEDCGAIGCQTQGFTISSGMTITGSYGDAMYSPLISNWSNASNATVEVSLVADQAEDLRFAPCRVAEIAGENNKITIKKYNPKDPRWRSYTPSDRGIVLGESYYQDVHSAYLPVAKSSTIINETGLPILITNGSSNNSIITTGAVEQVNAGEGNQVEKKRKNR